MNLWKDTYPLIVSCARGLAPLTAQELTRLGYKIIDSTENTVVVRGGMRDMMTLNLQLRTAHRVLVPLLRTTCGNLRYLYNDVYSIDWENLIDVDGYFTVNSVVRNETVRDTRMPSLTTKDAIVDRIRDKRGGRPDSGRETYGAAVFVYWINSELIIYIDTTGEPLSKRGYRKNPGVAPCRKPAVWLCAGLRMGRQLAVVVPMRSGTPPSRRRFTRSTAPGQPVFRSRRQRLPPHDPGEKAGVAAPAPAPRPSRSERHGCCRANRTPREPAADYATDVSGRRRNRHLNATPLVAEYMTFVLISRTICRRRLRIRIPYERLTAGAAVDADLTADADGCPDAAEEPVPGEPLNSFTPYRRFPQAKVRLHRLRLYRQHGAVALHRPALLAPHHIYNAHQCR